jgi:hypothetical protein
VPFVYIGAGDGDCAVARASSSLTSLSLNATPGQNDSTLETMQEPGKLQHEGMTEGDEALGQTPLQNEDVEAAQQPNLLNGVDSKELEGERGDEDGVEGHDDDRDDKKVAGSRYRAAQRRYPQPGRQVRKVSARLRAWKHHAVLFSLAPSSKWRTRRRSNVSRHFLARDLRNDWRT